MIASEHESEDMWWWWLLFAPVFGGFYLGKVLGICAQTWNDAFILMTQKRIGHKKHYGLIVHIVYKPCVLWCESRFDASVLFNKCMGPRMLFSVNRGNIHRPWKQILVGGAVTVRKYAHMHRQLVHEINKLNKH